MTFLLPKLYVRIVLLVFLFGIVVLCLNYYYRLAVLEETILVRRDSEFEEFRATTKVLFLGDSNTEDAIDPRYINSSFNLASSGESYVHRYYKLQSILTEPMPRLQAIALPFDLSSFSSSYLDTFDNEWYWADYIAPEALQLFKESPSKTEIFLKRKLPFLGNGGKIIEANFGKRRDLIEGHLVLRGDFSIAENKTRVAEEDVKSHFSHANPLDEVQLLYFKRLLALASERNLTVILIEYPLTEEYLTEASTYLNKTSFYISLTNLTEGHKNIHVLDYQTIFSSNASLFFDSHHMNQNGAEELSKLLARDLAALEKNNQR